MKSCIRQHRADKKSYPNDLKHEAFRHAIQQQDKTK